MKKLVLIGFVLVAIFLIFIKGKSGPNVSQNGISTHQLTDDIMSKYDCNSNNFLEVSEESFLRTENNSIRKVESRGLLFTDADKSGNNDGLVSLIELEEYMKKFDTDSDGEITSYTNIFNSIFNGKNEWVEFDNKYGEKFTYKKMEK